MTAAGPDERPTRTPRGLRRVILLVLVPFAAVFVLIPLARALAAVVGTHAAASASSCKQWTGAVSTSWTAGGNWTPVGAPATSDCVKLDTSVSVTNQPTILTGNAVSIVSMNLDQLSLTITGTGSLTLTGAGPSTMTSGTVTGNGSLIVAGTLNWSAGTMTAAGTTGARSTVVASGGTLNVAPTSAIADLDTRTLTNNPGGTVNYTPVDSGQPWRISCLTGIGTFANNGTFTYAGPAANDPGILGCGGTISNGATGTFTKSATAAATTLGWEQNTAHLNATSGPVQLVVIGGQQ